MAQLTPYHRRRDLISQLHDNFDRLLSPFNFRGDLEWPEVTVSEWAPSIDVKEEDKQYLVHADVPGVKADHIEINMENGILTIKGERQSEKKEEKENYLRVERSSGSFLRQLSLPEPIDAEKIEAQCQNGVLEIKLPKKTESAGRKIKVKDGS